MTADERADGWWQASFTARMDCEVPVFGRERLVWRRAPAAGSAALEVASLAGVGVAVRHGGWMEGPALLFSTAEWSAFLAGVRGGQFEDLPDQGT